MKKSVLITFALMLAMLPLSSCGSSKTKTNEPAVVEQSVTENPGTGAEQNLSQDSGSANETEATTDPAKTVTHDMAGNPIELPQSMDRIVSTAPALTNILAELGLGDKIVGIDENSKGVEGITEGIPEFNILSPDTERLIALEPDIIFATAMSIVKDDNPFTQVSDAGVCIVYFPTANSISDIEADIEYVGKVTGKAEQAQAVIDRMNGEIEQIRLIGSTIEQKKKVLFEISAAPYIYSFGKNVYLNEMLEIIGAENIFYDMEGWLSASEETIIAANPDVILTNVSYIDDPVAEIMSRNGWNVVSAVQNGQVYSIDSNASAQPCQNIVVALKQMAEAVYPEYFN